MEKIKEMAQVIAWLDSARWAPENQTTFLWEPPSLSSPSQNVLVHWLTYITDIQRPWQYVWRVGQKVFVEVVKSFSDYNFHISNDVSETQCRVLEFLDNFRAKQQPRKVRAFKYEEIEYRPRFPNQHNFIERTLTVPAHSFDRNFMKFIGESIKKWSNKRDGLHNVARDLYFLTYSDYSLERTVKLFENEETQYPHWNHFGYKRLWAALRDYRKSKSYLQLFHQGLMEATDQDLGKYLFRVWTTAEGFSLYLLELPGDVWNIEFLRRLVIPIAERSNIRIKKSWGASRIAREIYNVIGGKTFYPEQLDVSWDLSAKACENGLCDLCPFSRHDLRKICLKDEPKAIKNKYCPLALAICQYRLICNPKNCPVAEKKGKGLCEGVA